MLADARPPARHELPRCCRREDGLPKRAFLSRGGARWYAKKVLGDSFFQQYRCPACGYWHNATKEAA